MNPKLSAVVDIIAKRKKARELAARKKRRHVAPIKSEPETKAPAENIQEPAETETPAPEKEAPESAESPAKTETPAAADAPIEGKKKYKKKRKAVEVNDASEGPADV